MLISAHKGILLLFFLMMITAFILGNAIHSHRFTLHPRSFEPVYECIWYANAHP